MKMLSTALTRISAILSIVVFAAITSPFAVAYDSGWYGGFNVGQSRATIDEDDITSGLLGNGFGTTSFTDDDRDIGFKVFGGYQFNRYFAMEGGYFDLGKFDFTATTVPAGTLSGDIKLRGGNIDALGILPVTERFSAFARVGAIYAEARDTFTGTGFVNVIDSSPSKSAVNYKFGLGLQFDFTEALGLRIEAERYRINDAVGNHGDVDLLSAGLVYQFGAAATPPPRRAETPEPAPAAAAGPELVLVPALDRRQRYCSILDLQFEINMDSIQRADMERLSVVGAFMEKYPNTKAVIQGHTDNVGSSAANMRLSLRRAESVVQYLVDNYNIASSRLQAEGYGEMRPTADNRTEAGKRRNRRINAVIACATDIEGIPPVPARLTMALEMEFDTNRTEVKPQYREELRKVADYMQEHPEVIATVEGHTSNQQGASSQDMRLSQRRAESVVSYLVSQFGADRTRLFAQGFGHTRRVAYNTSAEGQQENRRVNIIFDFPGK